MFQKQNEHNNCEPPSSCGPDHAAKFIHLPFQNKCFLEEFLQSSVLGVFFWGGGVATWESLSSWIWAPLMLCRPSSWMFCNSET